MFQHSRGALRVAVRVIRIWRPAIVPRGLSRPKTAGCAVKEARSVVPDIPMCEALDLMQCIAGCSFSRRLCRSRWQHNDGKKEVHQNGESTLHCNWAHSHGSRTSRIVPNDAVAEIEGYADEARLERGSQETLGSGKHD